MCTCALAACAISGARGVLGLEGDADTCTRLARLHAARDGAGASSTATRVAFLPFLALLGARADDPADPADPDEEARAGLTLIGALRAVGLRRRVREAGPARPPARAKALLPGGGAKAACTGGGEGEEGDERGEGGQEGPGAKRGGATRDGDGDGDGEATGRFEEAGEGRAELLLVMLGSLIGAAAGAFVSAKNTATRRSTHT
jgi:hypothetical protein